MSSLPEVPTVQPRPRAANEFVLPPPSRPEFASPFLPDEPPEMVIGQAMVAIIAGFLPLAVSLYAIKTAGDDITSRLKLLLAVGLSGVYGAGLVGIGHLLSRRVDRVVAARTLIIIGGVIGILVAMASWFAPLTPLIFLSTAGAMGLVAVATGLYARLIGSRVTEGWPLLIGVGLVGTSPWYMFSIGGRPVVLAIDVFAALFACAVYLKPARRLEPAGRVALALAFPAASLFLKPLWWVKVPQVMGVAVTMFFVLRAIRPHLRAGTPTLCAIGVLGAHLLIAAETIPSRTIGLLVAVVALLLIGKDADLDGSSSPLERRSFWWLAAFAWIALAVTWAKDSRLVTPVPQTALGTARTALSTTFAALTAAFALPLVLPAFVLSHWRRRTAPIEVDLEELPRGTVAEVAGWGVLVAAQVIALAPGPSGGWLAIGIAGTAAVIGLVWSRAVGEPIRFVAAHLLLLGVAWGVSRLPPTMLPGPAQLTASLPLVAGAIALLLALAPWVGGARATGILGFVAAPLLVAEALYRQAPPTGAALVLTVYGLAHLMRPPLAEFPATRLAGPAALVSAAWLILANLEHTPAAGLPTVSRWFEGNPLPLLGVLAGLLAVPLLLLARRQRRIAGVDPAPPPGPDVDALPIELDPGFVFEAMAWALLTLGFTLALTPLPAIPGTSVLALATGALVAQIWARLVSSPWRRGGAHVVLVAAGWALGRWLQSPPALLLGGAMATLLAISPLRIFPGFRPKRLGGSEQAGWVGLVLLPLALADALTGGAPVVPAAALLAVVGVSYVFRSPLRTAPWTQAVGPCALIAAGWLILFHNGASLLPPAPLLAADVLPAALALALVPFALWVAITGGPVVFLIEVIAGALALALVTCTPWALLPLFILALGRGFVVAAAGAPALLAGALIVSLYGPSLGVPAGALAFAAGGAVLLFRPVPEEVERLKLLAFPGLAIAPTALAFLPRGDQPSFLDAGHLPLVAAATMAPFGLWLWRRPRPSFLVSQTLATASFVALLAIGTAFVAPAGTWEAIEPGIAALIALAVVVGAARGVNTELRPLAWGFAAVGALLALAPASRDPWHLPVTFVGAVDVLLLGRAARRRESPVLAAFALWSSLLVMAWMAAALTGRFVGGDFLELIPSIGIAAALAGILVLRGGSRWLSAPPFFLRPFIQTCLVLAAVAAAMSLTMAPSERPIDIARTLIAAVAVAVLALDLAFADRLTWPLFLVAGALILPIAYLRARTGWFVAIDEWYAGWDAVALAAGAAFISALEAPLRRHLGAPPIPALPEDPAELPFAISEVRLVAAILAGSSAIAFLDLRSFQGALGPVLASLYFLWRTRREEDHGPSYGILAAVFLNTSIVLLLLDRQITDVGPYALPIFFSIALLMHAYREHLGHDVTIVRAVPAGLAFALCLYDAINRVALIPTLALAVLAVGLLGLARWFRLRSYLLFGLLGLALAGFDAAVGIRFGNQSTEGAAIRLLPIASMVFAALATALLSIGPRLFVAPAELLRPFVNAALVLAALIAAIATIMAPVTSLLDIGSTLVAVLVVGVVAVYSAVTGDRIGWPLLIAGGACVVPYVYLRARTGWLPFSATIDGLVAVAAALIVSALEPAVRRASGAPARPLVTPEPPDEVPFGVVELRLVAGFMAALAAVAYFDFHRPTDAIAPALATLYFLGRTRGGNPIYSVLAAALINATVIMFLIDRGVTSPSAYALPFFASVAVLLHVHRDLLSDQDSTIRVLPPVAAGASCAYEAMIAKGQLVPALALAVLGFILIGLSRVWRLKSHVPVGLACIAAALLTAINEWNARGWTTAAIALGIATLLVPVLLLRWR
jgi:hypothetical protein